MDFSYRDDFYAYVFEELESKEKANGMDLLNDFVLDNRELFEEVDTEDINDFVSSNYEELQSWIKNDKPDIHIDEVTGLWYLHSVYTAKNEYTDELETKLTFTSDERKLLKEELYNLNSDLIDDYKSLLSKIEGSNEQSKIALYECKLRLAYCANDFEKLDYKVRIYYWTDAASTAIQFGEKDVAVKCFKNAAQLGVKEQNYEKAADCYEKAFNNESGKKAKIQLARYARVYYDLIGNHKASSDMFIREMDFTRKNEESLRNKLTLWLYNMTSNYGEKPSKVVYIAISLLMICTVLTTIIGAKEINTVSAIINSDSSSKLCEVMISLFDSLYYSFVTFTTLGYGEITPNSLTGKIISIFLSVSGLLLTSLFMVTFVRKYSRP